MASIGTAPEGSAAAGPAAADPVAEALRLRNWALPLMVEIGGRGNPVEAPPMATFDAWRLFIDGERCAIALHAVMEGSVSRLPASVRAELDRQRLEELKRSLSARGQIQRLAQRTAARGWKMLVLKGGAEIAEGGSIDVADVDVLLEPPAAADLASELDGEGAYRPMGPDPTGEGHTPGHLAGRLAPGGVQVEIHYELRGVDDTRRIFDRAVPLEGIPGLWRLHPADHIYHLLWHGSEDHPDRLGRLRELRLLALAARRATKADLEEVRSRVDGLRRERELLRQLDLAIRGPRDRDVDEFQATAALRYLLIHSPRLRRASPRIRLYLSRAVFLLPDGWRALGPWLRQLGSATAQPVTSRGMRGLERLVPVPMDYGRRIARTAAALGTLPIAWSFVRRASRYADLARTGKAG